MITRILRLFVIILLLLTTTAQAQLEYPSTELQYIYQNWNNKNGLTQNSVADIVKDEEGYLWLATEEGVIRFDGTNFKVINTENTPGLHSGTFYDLAPSKQGIWAASLNTVLYLNENSITSYDFRNHIKNSWIAAISEDQNGRLWIGTNEGELFYIANQKIAKYTGLPFKDSRRIQVLSKGPGGLLIGTDQGLFQLNKNNEVVSLPGLKTQNIRALELYKNGTLWIGTNDEGLYRLSGEKLSQYTKKDGLNELFIRSLGISPSGDIWIGTSSSGIQIYKDGKFETLPDNGISNDGIKSIVFTEPDLIWLGTAASGLIQMKPARIQQISKKDGLESNVILPIYQHPNGEIWIGTAGQGLNRITNGKTLHYSRRDGLASEIIISLYGTDDKILIGTAEGLNIFNLKTGKFEKKYTELNGLANNVVQSVFEDSQGRIWISTASGGMHILEKGKVKRVVLPKALSNAELTSIFEDRRNNIWVGSTGSGIIRISPKNEIRHYKNNLGVSSDIVYAFYEDKEGALWLGTEAGLIPFQKNKIFNKSNGLKFNGIYRIIDDGQGYVWLSGNFGIQRISVHELLKQNDNESKTSQISARLFGTADGMANSETNGNVSPAGWKMNDGSLWFPTVEGIAVVKPTKTESKQSLGQVKINSIQYGGETHTRLDNVIIPPNVSNISINYTHIDLINPKETTYYYRLRGLTDVWEKADNRRTAYFTLLPPGEYIFEVKAEQYGARSAVSKFTFSVAPLFYQTAGFRWAGIALLLIIGFFVHKLYASIRQESVLKTLVHDRTKELQRSNEELELINQQLHTSREHYQSLFFQNPYAVFSLDLAGNFLSANKVTAALTGYSVEELLNMSIVPMIPRESIKDVLENFIKASVGETQNYQTEILTASGKSLYVDVTNLPVIIDGKIAGIYGVVKDITEEKSLADELLLANERFRLANKATSDSIWDWDLITGKVERKENFLELKLGYSIFDSASYFTRIKELTHPDDQDTNSIKLAEVLNDKAEIFWEEYTRLLKPDNSYAYIHNRGYIIRDKEGKALRMIGASQDITLRKLEEQQLKLMESVITHTTDSVTISKAYEDGVRIVFVNEAYTKMTGYTLSEISGSKTPILKGKETDPEEFARFEDAIRNWRPYKTETLNYKKNGEPFWRDINMVPVAESDGTYSHWVSIERDVTERKNQILAIEEQNKNLREIAWIQSHHVRAPLARMMGIINLFEYGCVEDSEISEYLTYLKQSGIELDDIIRDIVKKTEIVDGDYQRGLYDK